ncbi:UNVERIFIED_CONTAM: hypothetical protein HDU68_003582 [Siphonaria sp. JEL0065]|nr:hypothetical protein HDU68_003582 [Siphonaria sp. JEL0065]
MKLAHEFWKRTQSLMRKFHDRLWSDINASPSAMDLLPLHGGTPLVLLAFGEFAKEFESRETGSGESWFDHLLLDLEPHDSEGYQLLCASLHLPFRSPKDVLKIWQHKIDLHVRNGRQEGQDSRELFTFLMDAVKQTRRAETRFEKPDASNLIRAFSQYTLLHQDASFKGDRLHCAAYPVELDEAMDLLNRVFLSLFTLSMAAAELKDVGLNLENELDAKVLDAYQSVEPPEHLFSLFHYYPVEVRTFRNLRLPSKWDEAHSCIHSGDVVVDAIQKERWLDRPMAACGISRYKLPVDILGSLGRLSESERASLSHNEWEVVEKVATFELFQAAFGPSRFCGPAGTVWQFCLLRNMAGDREMDFDTAVTFVLLIWQYMGVLHHTRNEIVWIVTQELGIDVLELYLYFENYDKNGVEI